MARRGLEDPLIGLTYFTNDKLRSTMSEISCLLIGLEFLMSTIFYLGFI
jgi:hypothetical protein